MSRPIIVSQAKKKNEKEITLKKKDKTQQE